MASFFIHLGAAGLVLLGLVDALLFAPFGMDILLIVLVARHPDRLALYVAAATIGSTVGYTLVDAIARKGGEEALKKKMKPGQFEKVRRKMDQNAGRAVGIAAILPPPFPFTPVIAAAAAFQYPRAKLLPVLAVARAVRFLAFALLAHHFGRRLIRIIDAPAFRWFVIGLVVLSIIGSVIVVVKWLRQRGPADRAMAPASAE